jgi:hypothetical protein
LQKDLLDQSDQAQRRNVREQPEGAGRKLEVLGRGKRESAAP